MDHTQSGSFALQLPQDLQPFPRHLDGVGAADLLQVPLGCVLHKDVEHISIETRVHKAAVIPDPAGHAVLADHAVLHIIQTLAAF